MTHQYNFTTVLKFMIVSLMLTYRQPGYLGVLRGVAGGVRLSKRSGRTRKNRPWPWRFSPS